VKRLLIFLFLGILAYGFFRYTKSGKQVKNVAISYVAPVTNINKTGKTVRERIRVPEGYTKVPVIDGSFSAFISNFDLKDAAAKVINYDGKPYFYQAGHIGVLEIPVPKNGLQQCADALMRLRAEYLWQQNKQSDIGFNFTSGHYCSWTKYAQGYRPKINGNKVQFSKTATENFTKDNFYKYLNLIFTYSGTQSLFDELPKITSKKDLKIGDMLIYPGFPGHVMMIVDIAENEQGDRLFAFAQGNTPAQSVHIIKNTNTGLSPWYDIDFDHRVNLETPIYTFSSFDFVRFK